MAISNKLQLSESSLPQQKSFDGVAFPLVLQASVTPSEAVKPGNDGNSGDSAVSTSLTAADAVQWIVDNKAWLDEQWSQRGAVLLRGLPVKTAADFNAVVEAFGFEELPYVGGAAPRTNIVGRVFTANESPPDQKIPFHHEMAQVPEYPSRLFFFCEVAPSQGGETPLLLSSLLTSRLSASHPEFVARLQQLGLRYTRVLPDTDDPSSAIGRSWRSTFQTDDKEEAERKAARLGVHLQWRDDGCCVSVSDPIPAVRLHPTTGTLLWFNSMVAAYTGWKDARNDPRSAVTFGDGSPLPEAAVGAVEREMEALAVAVPWQEGDVLLVDNHLVQHSRREFEPPRRVLASLVK